MAKKPPDVEALFAVSTTWAPRSKIKAIEKSLRDHLGKILFGLNRETRRGFIVKSASETRDRAPE